MSFVGVLTGVTQHMTDRLYGRPLRTLRYSQNLDEFINLTVGILFILLSLECNLENMLTIREENMKNSN